MSTPGAAPDRTSPLRCIDQPVLISQACSLTGSGSSVTNGRPAWAQPAAKRAVVSRLPPRARLIMDRRRQPFGPLGQEQDQQQNAHDQGAGGGVAAQGEAAVGHRLVEKSAPRGAQRAGQNEG